MQELQFHIGCEHLETLLYVRVLETSPWILRVGWNGVVVFAPFLFMFMYYLENFVFVLSNGCLEIKK